MKTLYEIIRGISEVRCHCPSGHVATIRLDVPGAADRFRKVWLEQGGKDNVHFQAKLSKFVQKEAMNQAKEQGLTEACPICRRDTHLHDMTEFEGEKMCEGCLEYQDMITNFDDPHGKNWK